MLYRLIEIIVSFGHNTKEYYVIEQSIDAAIKKLTESLSVPLSAPFKIKEIRVLGESDDKEVFS